MSDLTPPPRPEGMGPELGQAWDHLMLTAMSAIAALEAAEADRRRLRVALIVTVALTVANLLGSVSILTGWP